MKKLIEIIASSALLLSKYLLSIGSIYGWIFSVLGYIFTAWLNLKLQLRIALIVTSSMAVLSLYGLYKWTHFISGLQLLDYIVIFVMAIFSFFIVVKEIRDRRPLWLEQSLTVIFCSAAYIFLGMKLEFVGWSLFLIMFINNTRMYYLKKAYIIGLVQVLSAVIAIIKLSNLN